MHSISNNQLFVQIADKGAELQSLYHKQHNLEYLWSGDPAIWGKKSPVLFPIVGGLKNNSYNYQGKDYKLGRHGFARDTNFELADKTNDSITFSLKSDKQTKTSYPFDFVFSVKYSLQQNQVQVTFTVENTDAKKLLFSVGAHPAFKLPLVAGTAYEDYYLSFSEKETAERYLLSSDGLIETKTSPLLIDENVLPLKKELFSNDAIVLKNLRSTSVAIKSAKTGRGLKVSSKDFPYLGIWAAKGADFVCIEPWCGIADSVNVSGKLEEKEGIIALEPFGKFEVSFNIEVF